MDIDLLGRTSNEVDDIVKLLKDVGQTSVPDDGIVFDPDSFVGSVIREEADYSGVRTVFTGHLSAARVNMQIDIGFGDVVTPAPEPLEYPAILDFPAPTLLGYTRETVIAEKLEALVHLRMLNSRMKDYFDMWILLRHPELNYELLRTAIERTFKNRNMEIDVAPIGLSTQFGSDPAKQAQWRAFLKRSALTDAPEQLVVIVDELRAFFEPILASLA